MSEKKVKKKKTAVNGQKINRLIDVKAMNRGQSATSHIDYTMPQFTS